MKILVISSNYPSKAFPNYGAFVYNLMQELANYHQISIISPYKVNHLLRKKTMYGEEKCKVYRPLYLSVGNKKIVSLNTEEISACNYKRAVVKTLKKINERPDIIYTHFLANALPILDYAT